jgi:hypothetical protein
LPAAQRSRATRATESSPAITPTEKGPIELSFINALCSTRAGGDGLIDWRDALRPDNFRNVTESGAIKQKMRDVE